jgi:hypothetical protein
LKKIIFLGVFFLFSGCSYKSYTNVEYPYKVRSYYSISSDAVWGGFDGCDDYYNPYYRSCGMCIEDEFWW